MITRRLALTLGLTSLAGCAQRIRVVAIDRAEMSSVKRIGVSTAEFPAEPEVEVVNSVARNFGLVGLISGGIVHGNRVGSVKAIMRSNGFDPRAAFETTLLASLRSREFTAALDAANSGSPPDPSNDALLTIRVHRYGFIAINDSDSSPYRTTVEADVRLDRTRDRSVLMQDQIIVSANDERALDESGNALGATTFPTFGEIEAEQKRAIASLRWAFKATADGIVRRLG